MMYATHAKTPTVRITWRLFLLFLGVSLFFFSIVNAQDLEVDIAPEAPRAVNYDERRLSMVRFYFPF